MSKPLIVFTSHTSKSFGTSSLATMQNLAPNNRISGAGDADSHARRMYGLSCWIRLFGLLGSIAHH